MAQKEAVLDLLKGFLPEDVKDVYQYYANRADSLYYLGQYTAALSDYKAAELLKGENNNVKFKLHKALCEDFIPQVEKADKYLKNNNITEAKTIYTKIITDNPSDLHSQNMLKAIKEIEAQNLIFVEGGTFTMGSEESSDETPHQVTLTNYYISKTEVTNQQYADFLNQYQSDKIKKGYLYENQTMIYEYDWGIKFVEDPTGFENPSGLTGWYKPDSSYENHPVVYVTWFGAYEFCRYNGYKLPTEAQWEYAVGGGIKTLQGFENLVRFKYAGSNNIDSVAWYSDNNEPYGKKQVATKAPNQLGIYDMTGNVWEWCQDWYKSDFYSDAEALKNDPVYDPVSSSARVSRGGSWFSNASGCRIAYRNYYDPTYYRNYIGFRFVLSPSL